MEVAKDTDVPIKADEPILPAATERRVNLNDKVKVRLTVEGIKAYIDYMNAPNTGRVCNPAIKPKNCMPSIDEDGFTTFQLWELFSIFSGHIYMGADLVFMPPEIVLGGE